MNRLLRIVGACVLAVCAVGRLDAAAGDIVLDQSTKDALEGLWIINHRPDQGPCVSAHYQAPQVELEFRKTGGRMVNFDPPDLFGAGTIETATRHGDMVEMTFLAPKGGLPVRWSVRLLGDRLAITTHDDNRSAKSDGSTVTAYRCGEPDWSVTGDVSRSMLESLTALGIRPGKWALPIYVEALPDTPNDEQCKIEWPETRRMLSFEIFGPVRYHIFGDGFKRRFEFAPIRRVRQVGSKTLALEVENESGSERSTETLSIDVELPRIHIAELNATFVRCDRRTKLPFHAED